MKRITIVNIYSLNIRKTNFTKQTRLGKKNYIDINTIIVGDFKRPLLLIGWSSK
jgi:hypothetical protein